MEEMGRALSSFSEALRSYSRKLETPIKVSRFLSGSLVAELEVEENQQPFVDQFIHEISRISDGAVPILPRETTRLLVNSLRDMESVQIEGNDISLRLDSDLQQKLAFRSKSLDPLSTNYTGRITKLDTKKNSFRLDVNGVFELECTPCLEYLEHLRNALGDSRSLVTAQGEARFYGSVVPRFMRVESILLSQFPANPRQCLEFIQTKSRLVLTKDQLNQVFADTAN